MNTNSVDVNRLTLSEWDTALPSSGGEVFHASEALSILDAHAAGELRLYGGFKGDHPVALLPVFVEEKPIGRVVTSPPPSTGVLRLGPLLLPNSPKQRKQETVNAAFTQQVLDTLAVDARLTLFRMVCSKTYPDPRPYQWNHLRIIPRFTYVLDLNGATVDDVMAPFSKSLRNEMRRRETLDLTIAIEGMETAKRICAAVNERFDEQGMRSPIDWPFVRDLLDALSEHHRVYVARAPDGSYRSGIIVLYSDDTAYYWQGGVASSYDGVSVNSLLHRTIIEDIIEDPQLESITSYDLVGANTEHLCRYKSQFGGTLIPYYVIESTGPEMKLAKRAYEFATR